MRGIRFSALLAGAFVLGTVAVALAADAAPALWRENRRLAAETALAATPKLYFLLNLEGRRITLKTRGMVLFEFPVVEQGLWGRQLPVGRTAIERRDALMRPAIHPGEEKTPGNLDEQILELADMPTSYRLSLAGGIEVDVLSFAQGRWMRVRQRARIWRWYLSRPLVTLRQRRQRRETASLFLVLPPADAQRVYWSFYEGLDGILIPP